MPNYRHFENFALFFQGPVSAKVKLETDNTILFHLLEITRLEKLDNSGIMLADLGANKIQTDDVILNRNKKTKAN